MEHIMWEKSEINLFNWLISTRDGCHLNDSLVIEWQSRHLMTIVSDQNWST
jgi:hypothetical protein